MVAHHPGLPNPEISKIIGDQWKNEHSDIKAQWNRLAEEEKLRHKRQFPDYRYQPRRGGNKGVPPRLTTSSGGPGQDPGRCPKCRGRYITTPRTPLTPYVVSPPVSAGMASSSGGPPPPYHHQQQQQRWNHPPGHPTPPPPLYDIQEDYTAISPSDPKRRRYHAPPPPGGPGPGGPYQGLPSPSPSSTPYGMRGGHPCTPSIPNTIPNTNNPYGPHGLLLPNLVRPNPTGYTGGMPPPPRPGSLSGAAGYPGGPQGPRGSASSGASDFDESLRLPPLQTHHLSGASVSPTDMQQPQPPRHSQDVGGGLQATVMSIPYVSKLTVLERISPPLPGPGPAGPPRGPIIAVEGAEGHPRLLRVVGGIVERALVELGECEVRTWAVEGERRGSAAVEVGGQGNLFGAYLKAMLEWHAKAGEMAGFVTGGGGRGSVSDGGKVTPPPAAAAASSSSTAMVVHAPPRQRRLPIALLPAGYSLTTADHFACAVPVHKDAYAPVDHWQWMATLWRGIAAADLVVYVRVASDEELGPGQLQAVELKAPGLMVVRVPASVLEDGGIGEKAERRLGFEVVEWVREGVFSHFWGGAGRGGGHSGQGGMGGYGREG